VDANTVSEPTIMAPAAILVTNRFMLNVLPGFCRDIKITVCTMPFWHQFSVRLLQLVDWMFVGASAST
jgi:hypothetical protein